MFNGYYPQQQPMMVPNYRQPMAPMPQQMPQEETLYVPNEQAAESYLMAPNSFVRLWDANNQIFYEKRTDPQGRPYPMEKYEFRKVTTAPEPAADLSQQFVTRKEFEELMMKLNGGTEND